MPIAGPATDTTWGILLHDLAPDGLQQDPADGGSLFILADHTLLPGIVVLAAAQNLQPTPEACARSCRAAPDCSGGRALRGAGGRGRGSWWQGRGESG